MRVSAKVDYALRAMAELAAAPPGLMTAGQLASAQHIPPKQIRGVLEQTTLADLAEKPSRHRLAAPVCLWHADRPSRQ